MKNIWATFAYLSGLLLFGIVSASAFGVDIKSTTKSDLCVEQLTEKDQERIFSRIVNIGASYSKGCFTCDFNSDTRKHLKQIGEFGWVNRHYLIKFLKRTNWENPDAFDSTTLSVVENDPKHDGSNLFDAISDDSPYRNVWSLDFDSNDLSNLNKDEIDELLYLDDFKLDSQTIGGLRTDTSLGRDMTHNYGGHLYQTNPGIWNGNGGRTKSIFDFAVDGTRSSEIFSFLGDEALYQKLVTSGWKNQEQRTKLLKTVGRKIAETNPTIILSSDALFWDSVPRFLARIHNTKGVSWLTKVLTSNIIRTKLLGKVVYPIEQEERMISDFLTLLSGLSNGEYGNKPVPVVVARLIHDAGYAFEEKVFAEDFGRFVGTVIKNLLGVDISKEAIDALRGFKRADYEHLFTKEDVKYLSEGIDPGVEIEGVTDWVLKKALRKVVKDLPLVVMALEKSFNETNNILKKFVDTKNTNFKVIEVDDFYKSIPYTVSPVTIHPSSYGSEVMADILNEKLCDM